MAVGFGIVGCGMIAKFHARAIRDIKGAKLVSCFNRTIDKASALAAEFGGDPTDNLDAMLKRPDIDVVTICTPSGAHMEPAIAAAKAGKHVIVEKPLDVTLKRCDAMIDDMRKSWRQARDDLSLAVSQVQSSAQESCRRWTLRSTDAGRCLC